MNNLFSLFRLLAVVISVYISLSSNACDRWITMDMVHNNPGEAPTSTIFNNPATLRHLGYDAKVFFLFDAAQFGIDWSILNPHIFAEGSAEHKWMSDKQKSIAEKYDAAKGEGLRVYCMLDMLVLPRKMVSLYADSLLNDKGKIDIQRPFTQHCVRLLMRQIFATFPQLDGLVIRTGETYLNDAPYHQGNHPVQTDIKADHITLINILRQEVCVALGKDIFYRTWDFGQFHSLPRYYTAITDIIEPHKHLYFSIKHTTTDFWRGGIHDRNIDFDAFNNYWIDETSAMGNPFNPTIGIGRHKQIVEVQCQREYEGKAVHPNYIAAGVIDGFSEYRNARMPHPYCLNHLRDNKLVRGIWTWTRGGGWGGPYLTNEFWVQLNAYVLTHWAKSPKTSEHDIFRQFAISKGLNRDDIDKFHRLCMLSLDGVLSGQYSQYGKTWVNWTREASAFDPLQHRYIADIVKQGKQKQYNDEKDRAVAIWTEIEQIAKQLRFSDTQTGEYVKNSCTYARLKYTFFASAWHLDVAKAENQILGANNNIPVLEQITANHWNEWNEFLTAHQLSQAAYRWNR